MTRKNYANLLIGRTLHRAGQRCIHPLEFDKIDPNLSLWGNQISKPGVQ
ncbi:MAG: hypothetical protein AAF431_11790 [Pseudomonadota bacterium]